MFFRLASLALAIGTALTFSPASASPSYHYSGHGLLIITPRHHVRPHHHATRIREARQAHHSRHLHRMARHLHAEPVHELSHALGASGIASVYCDHRTASGEHMNCAAMTAAHRSLPFGTQVRVTSRSGRSVVVRINDRGPFVHGRIIDLSPAAARSLGMDGLAAVSLRW